MLHTLKILFLSSGFSSIPRCSSGYSCFKLLKYVLAAATPINKTQVLYMYYMGVVSTSNLASLKGKISSLYLFNPLRTVVAYMRQYKYSCESLWMHICVNLLLSFASRLLSIACTYLTL